MTAVTTEQREKATAVLADALGKTGMDAERARQVAGYLVQRAVEAGPDPADLVKVEDSAKDVEDTERLMRYWAEGEGAAKIRWGEKDDFYRCEAHLGKYVQDPHKLKGLCANLHHRAIGVWPGQEDAHKAAEPEVVQVCDSPEQAAALIDSDVYDSAEYEARDNLIVVKAGGADPKALAKFDPAELRGPHGRWIHGAGEPTGLTSDQRHALTPRPWSKPVRAETIAALDKTPDGKQLAGLLDTFQNSGGRTIPRLRTDIEKVLNGENVDPGRADEIGSLLGAIQHSDAPKTLYRGMGMPGSPDDVVSHYGKGSEFNISLGSFTSDQSVAKRFQEASGGQHTRLPRVHTKVFVKLVGDDTKALPLANLADNWNYAREKEWITSGKFVVDSTHVNYRSPNGGGEVTITVHQEGAL